MDKVKFDNDSFYAALDAHRAAKKITWRQVAAETGVSASTLTRMAQGRLPDVAGLARLCAWSGLNANDFIRSRKTAKEPETLAKISTYLRADPNLEPETAEMLDKLIRSTYETFRKKPTNGDS
jgi:transcriptional regulator with XRE-family HTH domain